MSCLAKQPADRPQSARILRERLLSIELPGEWTDADADQWWEDYAGEDHASGRSSSAPTSVLIDLSGRKNGNEGFEETLLGVRG
jgi:hypothetical protein